MALVRRLDPAPNGLPLNMLCEEFLRIHHAAADLSPGGARSGEGPAIASTLVVTLRSTDDFCRMMTGRLNLPIALFGGALRVNRDLRLFLRLNRLFSVDARP